MSEMRRDRNPVLFSAGRMKKHTALIVFCCAAITLAALSLVRSTNPAAKAVVQDTTPPPPPKPNIEFGLLLDSFSVHRGVIKNNQFLAEILLKYHVPYPEIDRLVKAADSVFDVKKIVSGKKFAVLCKKDSTAKARYFIYQPNEVDYVVFDIGDSARVYRGEKKVQIIDKQAEGVINSSLYLTLQDQHLSPVIALKLSEIFAWTIDFYHLQKGDHFVVRYTEQLVDSSSIGIGTVRAALFDHKGDRYYAFRFYQDSVYDFFDEKAQSLRKAFLQMPLKFGRMSSSFSRRRFHPVQKRYKAHLGTDYAAPRGTPILAVGDGTVIESKFRKYNGNYVKIKHNSTYTTQYLHMSKRAVKVGDHVRQGDVIGYVGSTGLATGPHVCFRFWKNGQQVDHRKEKFPPSKPVKKERLQEFNHLIDSMLQVMGIDTLANPT